MEISRRLAGLTLDQPDGSTGESIELKLVDRAGATYRLRVDNVADASAAATAAEAHVAREHGLDVAVGAWWPL